MTKRSDCGMVRCTKRFRRNGRRRTKTTPWVSGCMVAIRDRPTLAGVLQSIVVRRLEGVCGVVLAASYSQCRFIPV